MTTGKTGSDEGFFISGDMILACQVAVNWPGPYNQETAGDWNPEYVYDSGQPPAGAAEEKPKFSEESGLIERNEQDLKR